LGELRNVLEEKTGISRDKLRIWRMNKKKSGQFYEKTEDDLLQLNAYKYIEKDNDNNTQNDNTPLWQLFSGAVNYLYVDESGEKVEEEQTENKKGEEEKKEESEEQKKKAKEKNEVGILLFFYQYDPVTKFITFGLVFYFLFCFVLFIFFFVRNVFIFVFVFVVVKVFWK
jgi:hypothetical protein